MMYIGKTMCREKYQVRGMDMAFSAIWVSDVDAALFEPQHEGVNGKAVGVGGGGELLEGVGMHGLGRRGKCRAEMFQGSSGGPGLVCRQ